MTHDLRLAFRQLRRRPGFALLVIATLALALGANAVVFIVCHALLLRPLPYPEPERLVRIQALKAGEPAHLAQREIELFRLQEHVFRDVAAYYLSQYNITGDGRPEAVPCAILTHDLFRVLGVPLLHGEGFPAADDFRRQYRVVLEHNFWQRRFGGDPDIVGQSVLLDGGSYSVEGVLAPGADFPAGVGLYRQVTEYYGLAGRRHSSLARLAPTVTLARAQKELDRLSRELQDRYPATNAGLHFEVVPLRESLVGAVRPHLVMLAGAVAFVLLIAVVNVLNLQISRTTERRGELAVRSALGAGRGRLARQLLVECLVLAGFGGLAGLIVSAFAMPALAAQIRSQLPAWMSFELDGAVIGFAALTTLVAGLAAGLVPAVQAARRAGMASAASGGSRATSGTSVRRLRGFLAAGEVALALILLTGAGLMVRSFVALQRTDPGFEAEARWTFRSDPPYWSYNTTEQLIPFYEQALERLLAIPGVEGAAANQNLPLAGLDENTLRVVTAVGQSAPEQEANPFVNIQPISAGWFEVMGIPLVAGRPFESADRLGAVPVAIVGQRLAERLWPGADPLGKQLKLGPPESSNEYRTVVGVARDVRSERLLGDSSFDLYLPHLQFFAGDSYFVLRTRRTGAALGREVAAAVREVDPDLPIFDLAPMSRRVADAEWERRVSGGVLVAFGVLGLILAAVGVYGVMAQTVLQRTREMGIRLAFGARRRDVLLSVLSEGARWLALGAVAGVAGALLLGRGIGALLWGVESGDPVTLLTVSAVLMAVALFACLVPALRAARVDPMTALRSAD
ncbi:MAG: ABC transporter permease [Acidobacteriota bacterium]